MNERPAALYLSCLLFFTAFSSSISFAEEALIFSAPPRESIAQSIKIYTPVAQYLTKVTGKKVIYQYPANWHTYTNNMRLNKYDFVFDEAQFVSWRIKHLNHRPAVKIPGDFVYTFVSKKNNPRIRQVNDLVAKKVCGFASPNQGTLLLYNRLNNPMRQPTLIPRDDWREVYASLMENQCEAAILPLRTYRKLDPNGIHTRIVYSSQPASGQAITVSQNLGERDFHKIREALLKKKGQAALRGLQSKYSSAPLIAASSTEYRGIHNLLQYSYGFDVY